MPYKKMRAPRVFQVPVRIESCLLRDTARAKAPGTTIGLIKLRNLNQLDHGNLLNDELGNAVPSLYLDGVGRIEVDGTDLELASIMGINETGSVGH